MHASTGSASGDAHGARHTNALAGETSPYLLQHAHNPVDWSPWGPAALARAREQDRPIFLSIGYSACHWCHVMERESFENPQVAAVLNAHFVPIKVDREERPDLDDVYMKATQALSGHGGWPMSVWLTPELEPFYAGTYFPLLPRWGQPGFLDVLANLSRAWESQRERVREQARRVTEHVRQLSLSGDLLPLPQPGAPVPGLDAVDAAAAQLLGLWDREHGGFGSAPKFPHADDIRLLAAQHVAVGDEVCLAAAVHTLDAMARGGIHDQLGGGFHRYSTDERWWIPHFEKMLYDNALLAAAYLEAWRLTGRPDFARVISGIAEWVLAEMVDPGGAFWSTQDADSEGEEGKFFVWSREEVRALLGADGYRLAEVAWNLRDEPNFEGQAWALVRARPDAQLAAELGLADAEALAAALEPLRGKLHAARGRRVRPATDDKVLVAWNGLMIGALASAAEAFEQPRWLQAARHAAHYCLTAMRPDGRRLLATARHGRAHLNATLADYAYLACGLLDLFEADGDPAWAQGALELVQTANAHFADEERAGWYFTSDDHETLIARPRDLFDGALPSSNGVMVEACLRLADLTGDTALSARAERALGAVAPLLSKSPSAFARMLLAAVRGQHATSVVLTGGTGEAELRAALRLRRQAAVSVFRVPAEGVTAELGERWPLLAGKSAQDGRAAAFVCRRGTCTAPVSDVASLQAALAD